MALSSATRMRPPGESTGTGSTSPSSGSSGSALRRGDDRLRGVGEEPAGRRLGAQGRGGGLGAGADARVVEEVRGGDEHHLRRQLGAAEPGRIAAAVGALVVAEHVGERAGERRDRRQDPARRARDGCGRAAPLRRCARPPACGAPPPARRACRCRAAALPTRGPGARADRAAARGPPRWRAPRLAASGAACAGPCPRAGRPC